jgi:hypothetical protein
MRSPTPVLWIAPPASGFTVGHDLVLDGGVEAIGQGWYVLMARYGEVRRCRR